MSVSSRYPKHDEEFTFPGAEPKEGASAELCDIPACLGSCQSLAAIQAGV